MFASEWGRAEVVVLLLAAGAEVGLQDKVSAAQLHESIIVRKLMCLI
jgi:hypothetical protein